jgi:hypothetical protein
MLSKCINIKIKGQINKKKASESMICFTEITSKIEVKI